MEGEGEGWVANLRVQREAVPDEIPRHLLVVVILWDDDSTAIFLEIV